jgi:[protein-PII] uridylyltransferase
MYAPHWTTAETGPVAGPVGAIANRMPARHDAMPGAAARHVLRAIASEGPAARQRGQSLSRVRALLNREHAALRARFEQGGSVEALMRGRTRVADGTVLGLLHLARAATARGVRTMIAPVTVLAVGGYGRRELAPASDLDLLFVIPEGSEQRAAVQNLIGLMLTGLWDLGFTVGHATRTAAECRALADADPAVLASLLDARLLAGAHGTHAALVASFRAAEPARADAWARAIAGELLTPTAPAVDERDPGEPDVKRGRGGLRDIQRLLWLAALAVTAPRADGPEKSLRAEQVVPAAVLQARRFLWRVRCHLHLLAGRAQDRLLADLQPQIARRMGIEGDGRDRDATELMAQYRSHTRAVCALLTAQ